MNPKIRILLVDDHAIVRQGLRLLLDGQPDMEVLGEAGDGEQAMQLLTQMQPNVVLMDLAMPGMNGMEATRQIKRSWPAVQVIGLTVHDNDEYLFQMIIAGASGYVLKGADPAELLEALRATQRGEIFLHQPLTTKLVRDYLRRVRLGEALDAYHVLSDRELQVLRLIGEGHTAREIADVLTITVSTVQTHRAHIMDKLDLRKRSELINYALRHQLVGPCD